MSEPPQCCICLGALRGPVSAPCGHCFCLGCIGEYWRVRGECVCPLCQSRFRARPELRPLQSRQETSREEQINAGPVPLRAGEVSCDLCRGPAVRSCVQCLSSYCDLHLGPHYRDAGLGRHLLVSLVKNLEEAECRLHGGRLERFCRTDQSCICARCARAEHRGHRTVSVRQEAARRKAQLRRRRSRLQGALRDRAAELQRLRADPGARGKDGIRELEEHVSELQAQLRRMEQLLHTEDGLQFLQRFLLTAPL